MENEIILQKGDSLLPDIIVYDNDGNPLIFGDDAYRVLFTIRETETADALLQIEGMIESKGEDENNPGIITAWLKPIDTKDLPVGEYWYDVEVLFKGHWFDIIDKRDLYLKLDYGKVKNTITEKWIEVEGDKENGGTWLELQDNTVNFIQILEDGEITISTGDYIRDSAGSIIGFALYRVLTENGQIVDVFPYGDWFSEGEHTGLTFNYNAGKVLGSDNTIINVPSGSVLLKSNIVNYIEVSKEGAVSSNIKGFSKDKYPLYKVETASDSAGDYIKTVEKQSMSYYFDDRNMYIRGDEVQTVVKDKIVIEWSPTKPEDTEKVATE